MYAYGEGKIVGKLQQVLPRNPIRLYDIWINPVRIVQGENQELDVQLMMPVNIMLVWMCIMRVVSITVSFIDWQPHPIGM